VRISLVKKIADPELDDVIFRMTFVNMMSPLSIAVVVALLPTYPLIQSIILLVIFGSQLIYNVVHHEYIFIILKPKNPIIFAIYSVNVFLLLLVSTFAFDNLKPFITLATLKFISRFYMILSIMYWGLILAFIGIKFREVVLYNQEHGVSDMLEDKSEEIENLVKKSLSMSANNSKFGGLMNRLKQKEKEEMSRTG
jgi:putative Mn2+ efflux pump MntP